MTSEKFRYDPDEEEKKEPEAVKKVVVVKEKEKVAVVVADPKLDRAFYILVVFTRKKKGDPDMKDKFLFDDYAMYDRLSNAFNLCYWNGTPTANGSNVEWGFYKYDSIARLTELTTPEIRGNINDEYGFVEAASGKYKYGIHESFKKNIFELLSRKEAKSLNSIQRLYLDLLIKSK